MKVHGVILLAVFCLGFGFRAEACEPDWKSELKILVNKKADEDRRSEAGACLVRGDLNHVEVANALVAILRNSAEPLFLREDLVEDLGNAQFRRTVSYNESLAPGISPTEKEAVNKTVKGANALLAVAENVKTIKEVLPVTGKENEIVRALTEIVIDEDSHVILREMAVKSITEIAAEMRRSGLYSDHTLHLAYESLRYASLMPGEATYFIGAGEAYAGVSDFHNQILAGAKARNGRGLASESKKSQ